MSKMLARSKAIAKYKHESIAIDAVAVDPMK